MAELKMEKDGLAYFEIEFIEKYGIRAYNKTIKHMIHSRDVKISKLKRKLRVAKLKIENFRNPIIDDTDDYTEDDYLQDDPDDKFDYTCERCTEFDYTCERCSERSNDSSAETISKLKKDLEEAKYEAAVERNSTQSQIQTLKTNISDLENKNQKLECRKSELEKRVIKLQSSANG